MNDIDLAKKALLKNKYSVCVFKNGDKIYYSKKIGILPLYNAFLEKTDFSNCSAADKVIGLGAAKLWKELKILKLSTKIISKPALLFLKENDIEISHEILTNRIKNKAGDGFCPIETLAKQTLSFDDFIKGTKKFLKEKGLI